MFFICFKYSCTNIFHRRSLCTFYISGQSINCIDQRRSCVKLFPQCIIPYIEFCVMAPMIVCDLEFWTWPYAFMQRCKGLFNGWLIYQAPVPLTIFRSNSKFDKNLQYSSLKCILPTTTKFCTRHDSDTVVTCAKFRCNRLSIFETRAFPILIEFRIRSKYR